MQEHVLGGCGMGRQNEIPALPCYRGFALISRHTDSGSYDSSPAPVQYDAPQGGCLVAVEPNSYRGVAVLSESHFPAAFQIRGFQRRPNSQLTVCGTRGRWDIELPASCHLLRLASH